MVVEDLANGLCVELPTVSLWLRAWVESFIRAMLATEALQRQTSIYAATLSKESFLEQPYFQRSDIERHCEVRRFSRAPLCLPVRMALRKQPVSSVLEAFRKRHHS